MTQQPSISVPRDEQARKVLRGDRDLTYPVVEDPDLLLGRNVIVRAGAGSGKTSILIDRMIVLVRQGVAPSSIVAITFTNRAAAELKERFFKRLLEIRSDFEGKKGDAWEAERTRVEEALRHSDEVFIGTIHSFCLRLLRQRSLQAGLPPDFRQIEESDELTLRQSFWQARVEDAHASNDPDWAVLVQGDVSWSGLFNFFGMLSSNQSVTFRQSGVSRPDVSAAHARTLQVLDALSVIIPPSDNPDVFMTAVERARLRARVDELDDFRRMRVMKALMEGVTGTDEPGLSITASRWDPDRKSDLNKLAASIKKGEDELLDGEPVREPILGIIRDTVEAWDAWLHDAALRFAGHAVEAYRDYRVREGLLTYDDLLHEARRLVFASSSARADFQGQYGHFLVDEFQDTDPAQAALLFGLCSQAPDADDWTASRLESGKLFVVGDDKQSIYRFRKADFQVFAAVAEAVKRDGGKEVRLTANFRTDEALCDWINRSVGEVFVSREAPYQAEWEALAPAKGRIGPAKPVVHLAIGKSGQRAQKPRVVAEAATIAGMIHESVSRGESRPGDHMVLVRTHSNVPIFLNMFSRLGIPVALPGGKQRGAESVVRLVHDLFKVLLDPNDGISLVAILRGVLFGISDTDLQAYKSSGGTWRGRLSDAQHLENAPISVQQASKTLDGWATLVKRERPATAFEALLADTGLFAGLLQEPNGELLAGTLRRIGSLFAGWDEQGLSFASCVHELGRYRSGELNLGPFSVAEPFGACVRILTVHSSKGLQAPYVYLADCLPGSSHLTKLHVRREEGKLVGSGLVVRGSVPFESAELRPAGWQADAEEESRFEDAEAHRLMYVAATRAEKQLIISSHAEAGKGSGSWDVLGHYFDDPLVERIEVDPPNTEVPEGPTSVEGELNSSDSSVGRSRRPIVGPARWTLRRPSESESGDHEQSSGGGYGRTVGMQYGSAIHSLFEAVVARRKSGVDVTAVGALTAQVMDIELDNLNGGGPDGSDVTSRIQKAAASMMAFVESDLWRQLETADRVLTEVPFTTQSVDGEMEVVTSGVVDLAFRSGDQWTIVDYKTDRVEESVLIERHALQIQAYVQAWLSLFPDEPCRGLIWSTALNQAIPITSHHH